MASVNKVILVGRLGKDPELKYTPGGDAVTNIRIATDESYKNKQGEKVEKTEWHSIVFFGKTAEVVGEYLKKGSLIYVEGSLQTRKYNKDGVDHYVTEIKGQQFQFMEGKKSAADENRSAKPAAKSAGKPSASPELVDLKDDIPFIVNDLQYDTGTRLGRRLGRRFYAS